MKQFSLVCYQCGATVQGDGKPTRDATCAKCNSYLHCCRNCRFHEPTAYNECREPQAERVKDKQGANFCQFFEPSSGSDANVSNRKQDSLKKLNDLFKKN